MKLIQREHAGGSARATIWSLLDEWGAEGGVLPALLQRYTRPSWFEDGVHHSDKLAQELYSEAELRLMGGFKLMLHRKYKRLPHCGLSAGSASCLHLPSRRAAPTRMVAGTVDHLNSYIGMRSTLHCFATVCLGLNTSV